MKNSDKVLDFLNATIEAKDKVIEINDETIDMLKEMVAIQKEIIASSGRINMLNEKLIDNYKEAYVAYEKRYNNVFFRSFVTGCLTTLMVALFIRILITLIS